MASQNDREPPSERGRDRDSVTDLTTLVRERDKTYERRERERAKQAGQVFERVNTLTSAVSKLEAQVSELFSRDAYRQAKLAELEDEVSSYREDLKTQLFDKEERDEVMKMVKFMTRFMAVVDVVKWALPVVGIANVVAIVTYLLRTR